MPLFLAADQTERTRLNISEPQNSQLEMVCSAFGSKNDRPQSLVSNGQVDLSSLMWITGF